MRSLHLVLAIFCQLLLASFIFYTNLASGSPLIKEEQPKRTIQEGADSPVVVIREELKQLAPKAVPVDIPKPAIVQQPKSDELEPKKSVPTEKVAEQSVKQSPPAVVVSSSPVTEPRKEPIIVSHHTIEDKPALVLESEKPVALVAPLAQPVAIPEHKQSNSAKTIDDPAIKPPVALSSPTTKDSHNAQPEIPPIVRAEAEVRVVSAADANVSELRAPVSKADVTDNQAEDSFPVRGGLGPLHLLAATLCNSLPDRLVADENVNHLFARRCALRKSLYDFMSLKFTNLEKLSSRLNAGLEVIPPKTPTGDQVAPTHGWPVVGKCTAHDLRLMAEAAWCDAPEADAHPHSLSKRSTPITGGSETGAETLVARVAEENVASAIAGLNVSLTQQQLATLAAQASSTRENRKNALKLTKALFLHLAEDQREISPSWPSLYRQLLEDDVARKRMIDIVGALSGFRGESTSIRRDNLEFAFAMDDLRPKVLENEVTVPLTFDRGFIELEQFLQQSFKLMLANIDPERAKISSLRYRSLMASPTANEDQCLDLHQRLMAKNYPTDCNPTQFGQLPDVLRMAASSLELWSIEVELSRYTRQHEYNPQAPLQLSPTVHQCISNLVAA